jgi:hypothetical protein
VQTFALPLLKPCSIFADTKRKQKGETQMNKWLRIFPLILIAFTLVMVGCTDTDGDDDVVADHVLTGSWTMSNLEQSSSYYLAQDLVLSATTTLPTGYPLGGGSVTWATFSAAGITAVVDMANDFSFTLTGQLPIGNDTLGYAFTPFPLTDSGTWTAAADLSTLLIDGGIYDLGGALTLDDTAAPTVMSMAYSSVTLDSAYIPMDLNQDGTVSYGEVYPFKVAITDSSSSVLGFTK